MLPRAVAQVVVRIAVSVAGSGCGSTLAVRATEALFSCRASLACEQSADLLASPCAREHEDRVVLGSVASSECQ
jgi:hypothetical protein